jgi:hypothetical protein
MSLFFELLNSINDPKQSGSIDQLSGVMDVVKSMSQKHDLDPKTLQSVLSAMGDPMRSAIQAKTMGQSGSPTGNPMELLTTVLSGNPAAISSLFTPALQQQMVQLVSQKTGVSSSVLQLVVPALIPVVMNLFKMGGGSGLTTNSLFSSFLGGDRADLGQVFKYADRFLNPAH